MVLLLMIPARELYPNMKDLITLRHMENMSKILLVTGSMVGFAYSMEFFIAWYSGNQYEADVFQWNRAVPPWINPRGAPYWPYFWAMVICNVVAPQFLWVKKFRQNLWIVFIIANFANVGMWFERFVIIVTSLHRDFLPGSWGFYHPTWIDMCMFAGTFGLFGTGFLLFLRFLPIIAISEVKSIMPQAHIHDPHHGGDHSAHGDTSSPMHDLEVNEQKADRGTLHGRSNDGGGGEKPWRGGNW